jgi:hypothetical protein
MQTSCLNLPVTLPGPQMLCLVSNDIILIVLSLVVAISCVFTLILVIRVLQFTNQVSLKPQVMYIFLGRLPYSH